MSQYDLDFGLRRGAWLERRRIRRAQRNERNDLLRLRLTLIANGLGMWAASVNDITMRLDSVTRPSERKARR